MRLRPIVLAALLVALAFHSVHAQGFRFDGTWWKGTQDRVTKAVLLAGFAQGARVIGDHVAMDAFLQAAAETPKGDPGVEAAGRTWIDGLKLYHEHLNRYFKNARDPDQLLGGIDAFYADFRNLKIEIVEALWVVLLQLDGAPDSKIQQEIESLRAKAR